jgi:hypothetical protein
MSAPALAIIRDAVRATKRKSASVQAVEAKYQEMLAAQIIDMMDRAEQHPGPTAEAIFRDASEAYALAVKGNLHLLADLLVDNFFVVQARV